MLQLREGVDVAKKLLFGFNCGFTSGGVDLLPVFNGGSRLLLLGGCTMNFSLHFGQRLRLPMAFEFGSRSFASQLAH